tara:strand:- start:10323 stop:12872 length:2550 start_codon:yes stop_codon:yes gene_type:complete
LTGVVLDHFYKLESQFSSGGMSEIWRASHTQLPTARFLVKLLPAEFSESPAYIDALLREAALTRGLPSDSFTHVVHSGTCDGIAFYVMEEFDGEHLGDFLEEKYPEGMPGVDALPILEQILEAMSLAHAEGVIHGDLKPDNIFIERSSKGEPKVRILDFGVAKANSEVYATISKALPRGAQQYMPPELHKPIPDAAGPACDVFAIGLIAYQMILGRHPLAAGDYLQRYAEGRELGVLHETRDGKRAGVTAAISQVLYSAVRFNPEERCPDVETMLRILRSAQAFNPENLSEGTIVGDNYRITAKLGKGGMGAVYSAEHIHRPELKELVLKIVVFGEDASKKAKEALRQRFRTECESLHRLDHEAIPYIYANDTHEGIPFLVMEKAAGDRFDRAFPRLLAIGGWEAVFHMARQVASAIDAVHAAGLIHRDLKPANIMVEPTTGKAMVVDFGIARVEGSKLTAAGFIIGTPGFCPPEQCQTKPIPASDQWSFAACFYAMLTHLRPGTLPGEERSKIASADLMVLIMERIIAGKYLSFADAPKITEVPPGFVAAVTRAMSQDPAHRFPSLTAFVDAMAGTIPDTKALVSIPTEAALKAWIATSDALDETPFLLVQPTPIVLTATQACSPTALAAGQATPVVSHTPAASSQLTNLATENVRRTPVSGYVAPLALFLAVLGGAGYYVLAGRGGDSVTRKGNVEAPVVIAEHGLAVEVPSSSEAAPRPEVPAAPSRLSVGILAKADGVLVEGLELRIGNQMFVTPTSVELPAGVIELSVADAKYAGAYDCSVSEESPVCQIALVSTALHPQSRPSKLRKRGGSKNAAGFVDLDKHRGKGDSPFIFFDKPKKEASD